MKKIFSLLILGLGVFMSASVFADERNFRHREFDVRCGSVQNRYNQCDVGGRVIQAFLIQQHSAAACVQGRSWGLHPRGVWVNYGCRGVFLVRVEDRRRR